MDINTLKEGDVLLYRGTGLYGLIIRAKTWHDQGHVEVYIGKGQSVASRDGLGVGVYPVRLDDLMQVLRPSVPFQLPVAMDWFYRNANHLPYGWLDLLQFGGFNVDAEGIVCSPFAVRFLRAGGVPVLNGEIAEKVAPFELALDDYLTIIYSQEQESIMASFWKTVGNWALKFGVYALGHQAVIAHTIADAKAKNIVAVISDAQTIAAGIQGQ